jgi:hypothetical protein
MPAPADLQVIQRELPAWVEQVDSRGIRLLGRELDLPDTAVTVRVRDGETLVTDGPFAETKELIAGWMAIDVDSYERAIELAGELSAAPGAGGKPIYEWLEVRPFLTMPPDAAACSVFP